MGLLWNVWGVVLGLSQDNHSIPGMKGRLETFYGATGHEWVTASPTLILLAPSTKSHWPLYQCWLLVLLLAPCTNTTGSMYQCYWPPAPRWHVLLTLAMVAAQDDHLWHTFSIKCPHNKLSRWQPFQKDTVHHAYMYNWKCVTDLHGCMSLCACGLMTQNTAIANRMTKTHGIHGLIFHSSVSFPALEFGTDLSAVEEVVWSVGSAARKRYSEWDLHSGRC